MTFTKQNINSPLLDFWDIKFFVLIVYNKFRPHTSRHQWNSRTVSTVTAVPVWQVHCICLILNGLLLCFYYYIWWVKRSVLIVTVDQEVSVGMYLYFLHGSQPKRSICITQYHKNVYISSFTDKYYTMEYIHANGCVHTLTKTCTQKHKHIIIIMIIRIHFQQNIPMN